MKTSTTTAVLALALAVLASDCSARQQFVSRIPNGDNVPGVKAVGHSDNTGDSSSRNQFGNDFADAGEAWTVSLCQTDSDGDGQTNGQELGDPCCEWSPGSTPQWTTVSHPADSSLTSDASLWANITCNTTLATTSGSAPTASTHSALVMAGAVSTALVSVLALL